MFTSQAHDHIPYEVLRRYVDGILEERALEQYAPHAEHCSRCARSRAYAVNHRAPAHMLWTSEGLILMRPYRHERRKLSEEHEKSLAEWFTISKSRVNIVAGEAHPKVYTNYVAEQAEKALSGIKEDLPIEEKAKIVCGPIIAIDESYVGARRSDGTIVTRFVRQRNFIVYFSDRRQKEHFRIGGHDIQVYVESPHEALQVMRESFVYRRDPIVCSRYRAKFDYLLDSPDVKPVSGEEELETEFILLRKSELENLKSIISERQLVYDDLTRDEIRNLIDENKSRVYASAS